MSKAPDGNEPQINITQAINNLKTLKTKIINTNELLKLYDNANKQVETLKSENQALKNNASNSVHVEKLKQELILA
jgi:hypothetical protein